MIDIDEMEKKMQQIADYYEFDAQLNQVNRIGDKKPLKLYIPIKQLNESDYKEICKECCCEFGKK